MNWNIVYMCEWGGGGGGGAAGEGEGLWVCMLNFYFILS